MSNKEIAGKIGAVENRQEASQLHGQGQTMARLSSLRALQDKLSVNIDLLKGTASERGEALRQSSMRNQMTLSRYELRQGTF